MGWRAKRPGAPMGAAGLTTLTLLAVALVTGARAQEAWPRPPAEAPGLTPEMTAAAGAFEAWTERAGALNGAFADKAAVARGLSAASPMADSDLTGGMIAYGALAALDDARFVAGVRAADRYGDLGAQLAADPAIATRIDGADEAADRVAAALARRGAAVTGAGTAVKQAAYTLQRQAWSKEKVADAAARLAGLKASATTPAGASEADVARALASLGEGAQVGGYAEAQSGQAAASPVVTDALALAAMAALGEARAAPPMLNETRGETLAVQCLRMARLNLYQCMAVAGPQYEDVFCLGEHELGEAGRCVSKAAGGGATLATSDAIGALLARPAAASYRPAGEGY